MLISNGIIMVLSIIVISHNQKEQLTRCLNSILAQSLPFDYEIIVSDDASVDASKVEVGV